ncbi:haloacid dehalogenase-like hydrolase domain-containing protein Sgpp [Ipomoea triloba]|uniref:haloacid dehalogenase-like hydrolase domain-containing protein Sgpp n=1 Tax=Ipomoea triloba TaxID=35885 RepID=UPI00125E258F|nr:haloacid dehalogenase-like hydrolase domain-containing protein Sgpp [Ipomoea triloba]
MISSKPKLMTAPSISTGIFPSSIAVSKKIHLSPATPFPGNNSSKTKIASVAPRMSLTPPSAPLQSECSLPVDDPLEAILFDIDGTLCDSDPIHYYAFREMLQEIGFNGGEPITEEFFIKNISGMHNDELCHVLFPDWDFPRAMQFMEDKEAMFRRLASEQLKPVKGLDKLCEWMKERGLRRAAVTNAPRPNAELIISMLGLADFFEKLVIGSECDRAKPFPDPYLTALRGLGVSNKHAFVFEDSISGIKAGVAAGMPVVGLSLRNPESLLSETGATLVIKDFDDSKLWAALDQLDTKTKT